MSTTDGAGFSDMSISCGFLCALNVAVIIIMCSMRTCSLDVIVTKHVRVNRVSDPLTKDCHIRARNYYLRFTSSRYITVMYALLYR